MARSTYPRGKTEKNCDEGYETKMNYPAAELRGIQLQKKLSSPLKGISANLRIWVRDSILKEFCL